MDGEPELDLSRPRSVSELLSTTLSLFGRHSGLFFSVTLLVVVPVFLLVDGVWGERLRDGRDADPGTLQELVSFLVSLLIVPAFVTALHAVIVRDMSQHTVPGPLTALRQSGPRLLAATGTVALYSLAVFAGLIAFVVPGVWLAVRLYFGAQSAVLDGTSPTEALSRSAKLVEDRWWWTAGALILSGLVFGVPNSVAHYLISEIDSPAVYVVLDMLLQTVVLSLSALFGTLLFFSLRAQRGY